MWDKVEEDEEMREKGEKEKKDGVELWKKEEKKAQLGDWQRVWGFRGGMPRGTRFGDCLFRRKEYLRGKVFRRRKRLRVGAPEGGCICEGRCIGGGSVWGWAYLKVGVFERGFGFQHLIEGVLKEGVLKGGCFRRNVYLNKGVFEGGCIWRKRERKDGKTKNRERRRNSNEGNIHQNQRTEKEFPQLHMYAYCMFVHVCFMVNEELVRVFCFLFWYCK